ncbi:MAG: PAS domain-containing protein, partial [Reichenbachiella sp.]
MSTKISKKSTAKENSLANGELPKSNYKKDISKKGDTLTTDTVDSNDEVNLRAEGVQAAVDSGWASIEFEPDGTILSVNDNWINALGYSKEDMVGQHHKMFCDPAYTRSKVYKTFWKDLANGKINSGEFLRYKAGGEGFWINASYTPIKNSDGEVYKVVKIASDITNMVKSREKGDAIKSAVDTAWASIEFEPDGTILEVNNNWVNTLGYDREEMIGQHHRMFCEQEYAKSKEYQNFWKDLANGKVNAGEFLRVKNGGEGFWINASYTPVKNSDGEVY